ncbi:response regulator [Mesorhizobium sp. M0615]|uniref:response regulator n=1 Tax=Mesorhizobium sp. M0615 TaxID=2956971 RepID=UPI00333C9E8B
MEDLLVLVVEDEPLTQVYLEDTLHEGGYTTTTVASGELAITSLEASPADVRALVTDINLKGEKTGWDVAQRARELFPGLPVIYVTSVSSAEWTSKGVPKSIMIQKPFAPGQIITAVSQLLNAADPSAQTA